GVDGLDLVRRLMVQLPVRVSPGGVVLLEVGVGQAGSVAALAESLPIPVATTQLPDLAGVERVVRIARLD
ncbi:MAG: peptide chain release factor N(5)-glutamine methyltransferase, partial [Acidobacteriota bacterium]